MCILLFLCLHFTAANVDYVTFDQNITFDSGDSNNTFSIEIVNDTIPEGVETFEVLLKPIPGDDLIIGESSIAMGRIFDDEIPSKTIYNHVHLLFYCCIHMHVSSISLVP